MKKILFTGAHGFLGKNIIPFLEKEYDIVSCGLLFENIIRVNLAKEVPSLEETYDIVFHAAGKVYTKDAKKDSPDFIATNYQGTINLCKALKKHIPKSFVYVSSVAVYGEISGENITEDYPKKGNSEYAKSKILAEDYLIDWCNEHNVVLTILRPTLIVGHQAKGLLASMINGIKNGYYFNISKRNAKKSFLLAEDIANILTKVADKGGIYNLCDSYHPSFKELSESISMQLNRHKPMNIPYWLAWIIAKIGDVLDFIGIHFPLNSKRLKKMTSTLTFSNEKAQKELSWKPMDVLTHYKI